MTPKRKRRAVWRVLALVAGALALTAWAGGSDLGPREAGLRALSAGLRPWHRLLGVERRFERVMGGAAVLDGETGLVWERVPETVTTNWIDASFNCYRRTVGGRMGWRLPTVEELTSLVDPSEQDPALPAGHPFEDVQPDVYWTATTISGITGSAYGVSFLDGSLFDQVKSSPFRFWCVRGGHGHDGL